jgi:DNA-binding NtrC family response regulator
LVIDRNEAFAAMLEQMLIGEGGYQVQVAHHDSDALSLLKLTDFDLTILDMDLGPKGDYQGLIHRIRQHHPTMRLMLIPLMGQDIPKEAVRLDIQGALAKPFFADDLLPSIRDALSRDVNPSAHQSVAQPATRSEPPPDSAPVIPSPAVSESNEDVQAVLADLANETRADVVLLLSANPEEGVIAQISALDSDGMDSLAALIRTMVQAAQAAGQFLGQPEVPFEHNMFESPSLRLYVMVVATRAFLVAVTPMSTPLGTVRHNLRRASRDLSAVVFT